MLLLAVMQIKHGRTWLG